MNGEGDADERSDDAPDEGTSLVVEEAEAADCGAKLLGGGLAGLAGLVGSACT